MMSTIRVIAQYYENYSDSNIPYWKAKGGVDFHLPLDADTALYVSREDLVNAISKLLEEYGNEHSRYEYRDHEVKFSKPIVVEGLLSYLQEVA